MVTISMMPAELATLGLLKTRVFWNEGYDVIISVPYVISLVTLAFLREKLSTSIL